MKQPTRTELLRFIALVASANTEIPRLENLALDLLRRDHEHWLSIERSKK